MKVIEQFIASRTGDMSTCEDGLFISDDFCVVVDGSRNQLNRMYQGKTTAQIARDSILTTFPTLQKTIAALEAILALDSAIATWYQDNNLSELMQNNPAERCSASLIIYSKHHHQLWMVGDCQAFV